MPPKPKETMTQGQGARRGRGRGMVAAAVLAAIRYNVGDTQEQLAGRLKVSLDAVARWESGSRSLARVSAEDLWRHQQALLAGGATPELVSLLDDAIRADLILTDLLTGETPVHPLATLVPARRMTELLAWPISGTPPRQIANDVQDPHRAKLATEEHRHLVRSLQRTAEAAPANEHGAMLRRQTAYLADASPGEEGRGTLPGPAKAGSTASWDPEWPVWRSHAISAAASGDPELLHRFIGENLSADQVIHANLNYWAYWVGELPTTWRADREMVTTPIESWAGDRLLDTLLTGLQSAPYRELCAHTLHALLKQKPHLVAAPTTRDRTSTVLDDVLSTNDDLLTHTARGLLEQAVFLARSHR